MGSFVVFGISGVVLLAFVAFKVYERSHTWDVYVRIRSRADAVVVHYVTRLSSWCARVEEQLSFKGVVFASIRTLAVGVAHSARAIEKRAHTLVRATAHHRVLNATTTTRSSFLQEVSSHKKSLDTERIKRETSLTSEGVQE